MSENFKTAINEFLRSKAELFASLTAHTTLTGDGRELALAQFFEGLIPRKFEVLTGTMVGEDDGGLSRSQLDLMFVNTLEFPVLLRSGGVAVVIPESVHAIIEVKTEFYGEKLATALGQVRESQRLASDFPFAVLFAFGGPATAETLEQGLRAWQSRLTAEGEWTADSLPHLIIGSGEKSAAVAYRNRNDSKVLLYTVTPIQAMGLLLGMVLRELMPKPIQPIPSEDSPLTRDQQAWKRSLSYFESIDDLGESIHTMDLQFPQEPLPKLLRANEDDDAPNDIDL